MDQIDPSFLGKQLDREVHRVFDGNIKAFERALKRVYSGRGASYGSLWGYVRGQGSAYPPRELIEAFAVVLGGVRPDYLLSGGPRTAAEAEAREDAGRISSAATPSRPGWRAHDALVLKRHFCAALLDSQLPDGPGGGVEDEPGETSSGLPARPTQPEIPYWIAPLGEVELRLWLTEEETTTHEPGEMSGRALRALMTELGVSPADMWSYSHSFGDLMAALTPVLFLLADERDRQARVATLPADWSDDELEELEGRMAAENLHEGEEAHDET